MQRMLLQGIKRALRSGEGPPEQSGGSFIESSFDLFCKPFPLISAAFTNAAPTVLYFSPMAATSLRVDMGRLLSGGLSFKYRAEN